MWINICKFGQNFVYAYSQDKVVYVYILSGEIKTLFWKKEISTDYLMFLGIAVLNSNVGVIGQGHNTGLAYFVTKDNVLNLGLTAGNNPVAISTQDNRWNFYVCTAPDKYQLNGQEKSMPWSSQGIRQVLENGEIIFGDDTLGKNIEGHNFGEYTEADGCIFGQNAYNVGVLTPDKKFFIARRGKPGASNYGVHGARLGTRIATCALTENGPWVWEFDVPYPIVEEKPVEVPPIKEPPIVIPPIEDKVMKLPNEVKATRDKFIEKFPFPKSSSPSGEFEEKFRIWFGKLVQQIVYSHPRKGWGWKNAGGGRPPSKDSLANNKGELLGFDMFTGVGTGNPSLNDDPNGEPIPGQTFMEMEGFDYLNNGNDIPDEDDDSDNDDEDNSAELREVLRQLTKVKTELKEYKLLVEGLVEELSNMVKYGDRIGLRTDKGFFLCAENEGYPEASAMNSVKYPGNANFTRRNLGPYESFELVKP